MHIYVSNYGSYFRPFVDFATTYIQKPLESIESVDRRGKLLLSLPLLHNIFYCVKISQYQREKITPLSPRWKRLTEDAARWKWVSLVVVVALTALAYFALPATAALSVACVVFLTGSLLFIDMVKLGSYASSVVVPTPLRVVRPPASLPSPPATCDFPSEEVDTLEKGFWEECVGYEFLETLLKEHIPENEDDRKEEPHWGIVSNLILEQYESKKRENNPSFVLEASSKKVLLERIERQLSRDDHSQYVPSAGSRTRTLANGKRLSIYPTDIGGSCAFHALLGTRGANGVFSCNAKEKRDEFCAWLQTQFDANSLPSEIIATLGNYFAGFDTVPPIRDLDLALKNALRSKYEEYHAGYEQLLEPEKVGRREKFIWDREVFAAYLAHIQKPAIFLTQAELIAVGLCFKRRFYLCQPGWGNDRNLNMTKECNGEIFQTDPIYIWYNGYNHFERAYLVEEAEK